MVFAMKTRRTTSRGFVLMEVILAAGIFALAGIALAMALNDLSKVYHQSRKVEAIRVELESRLAEARVMRVFETREKSDEDVSGVVYEKEVKQLQISNDDKIVLTGLYEISITAKWKEDIGPQEEKAEIYVYQP
jgi:type II secretory pathway component PulJ